MKHKKLTYYLIIIFLLVSLSVFSHRRKPPRPKPAGPPPPHPELPIDGGIIYLLIAGITYGVYEVRKK